MPGNGSLAARKRPTFIDIAHQQPLVIGIRARNGHESVLRFAMSRRRRCRSLDFVDMQTLTGLDDQVDLQAIVRAPEKEVWFADLTGTISSFSRALATS